MMKKKPLFVSVIISLMLVILTTHSASQRAGTLEAQDNEWELVDEPIPHQLPPSKMPLGRLFAYLSRKSDTVTPEYTDTLETYVKEQLQRISTPTREPEPDTMHAAAETQKTIPQMQDDSQKIPESPVAQPKSPKPEITTRRQTAPAPPLLHAILRSHTTRRRPGKEHQLYDKPLSCPKKQTVLMVTERHAPKAETTQQRKTRDCLSSFLHCLKTLTQWN